MRKLYQRLALILGSASVLIVLIFTVSLYERSRAENGNYLNLLLDSVEMNIEHASADYEERLEFLKQDYLKRAWAVEYIISSDSAMISGEELSILKQLMEVRNISVIGRSGEILLSTDDRAGTEYEGREELEALRTSSVAYAHHVAVNVPDDEEGNPFFYVVEASDSEKIAAVRVDADASKLDLMNERTLIRSILRQATTEYSTGILAVEKESGEAVGITKNNAQQFHLPGIETGQELLVVLESLTDGKEAVLRVNGTYQRVIARDTGGIYLVAFSALDTVFQNMAWSFAEGLFGIGAVSVSAVLLVRYYLKKYLFQYFETVKEGIRKILDGASVSAAADTEIPEVRALIEAVLELEKGYLDKTEGIHQMEDALSQARTEAEYDKLTGLYNRRGMENQAELFLKKDDPAGVFVLFDLDNFKKINDFEGHPEGDRVLERFAECLGFCFRKGDSLGRLGGDEFAALLPGPVPQKRLEEIFCLVMSKVREELGIYYEKYGASVSIGAVPIDGRIRSYSRLYKCADTALYIAKYLGKDRYYINTEKISCMKRECVGCRADCPRSRLLDLKTGEK